MLLDITKTAALRAPAEAVWAFVRDPARIAACLPNVQDFRPAGAADRYATLLVERLGPFSVRIPLSIEVTENEAGREMVAAVSGDDRGGQARVRGEVRATVRPADEGATLEIGSHVEVLGRMAVLGAVPMRRRADQVFEQFVRTIGQRLEPGGESSHG